MSTSHLHWRKCEKLVAIIMYGVIYIFIYTHFEICSSPSESERLKGGLDCSMWPESENDVYAS